MEKERLAAPGPDIDPEAPAATRLEVASLAAGSGVMMPSAAALISSTSASPPHRDAATTADETAQVLAAGALRTLITLA